MASQVLTKERQDFADYVADRPSAADAWQWLTDSGMDGMERVEVSENPLEVEIGPGVEFLSHPLLRGGFLDDVYECFTDFTSRERDEYYCT